MAEDDRSADQFWEDRYRGSQHVWSGHPNAAVVEQTSHLTPGHALDLGCGEGADAIWLARQGWTVTGVDISPTAIGRARREAERQQVAGRTRFLAADLSEWEPDDGPYDLVTASFLGVSGGVTSEDVLHRVAGRVRPGGHLLVITHAVPPPWFGDADHQGRLGHGDQPDHSDHPGHPGHRFLSPMQEFAELGLDAHEWRIVTADTRSRAAVDSSGEQVELTDGILLIRRVPAGLHHGDFSSR